MWERDEANIRPRVDEHNYRFKSFRSVKGSERGAPPPFALQHALQGAHSVNFNEGRDPRITRQMGVQVEHRLGAS